MLLGVQVAAEHEADFNPRSNEEPIPDRLSIPVVFNAVYYEPVAGGPTDLVGDELASPKAGYQVGVRKGHT